MTRSKWWRFPVVTNYRGRAVPVWLGAAFAGALTALAGLSLLFSWLDLERLTRERRDIGWILVGMLVVFAAGLYDDFRPTRTRGIALQVRLLREGVMTSAVVKLVAITAAAALTLWMIGERGWNFVLGVGVVAGSSNFWNLLDVVPGRALKLFIPAVFALAIATSDSQFGTIVAFPAVGLGVVALAFDLGERSMLGDGGANVLGFLVGIGMVLVLPLGGLAGVFVALVLLHVLSETVTLSKLIDATPPLRWFDGLGRGVISRRGADSSAEL